MEIKMPVGTELPMRKVLVIVSAPVMIKAPSSMADGKRKR